MLIYKPEVYSGDSDESLESFIGYIWICINTMSIKMLS